MERARTEWLRARGFEQDVLLRDRRVLFAVRTLSMDYHRPARFNDLLEVVSRIAEVGGASPTFAQSIRRADSTEVLCARESRSHVSMRRISARRLPRQLMREIVGDP